MDVVIRTFGSGGYGAPSSNIESWGKISTFSGKLCCINPAVCLALVMVEHTIEVKGKFNSANLWPVEVACWIPNWVK